MPVEIVAIPVVSKYAEPGKPFRATVQRLDTVKVTAKLIDEYRNVVNLTGCTVLITATDKAKTTLYNATIDDAINGLIEFVVQPDVVGRYTLTAKVTSGNNDETTFFLGAVTVAVEDKDVGSIDTMSSLTTEMLEAYTNVTNAQTGAAANAASAAASASAAANSATEAAASAAQSANSATAAANSATEAAASAAQSANSATAAAGSASNSAASASAASDSQAAAKTSETNSKTSETNAATYANNANNSAASASVYASTASDKATAAETSATKAAASESNAAASATSSASSASAAAGSKTAAAASASAASTSEANASASESNALASKNAAAASAERAANATGLYYRGVWSSGTAYILGDFVTYIGAAYLCVAAVTGTTSPNSDSEHWTTLNTSIVYRKEGIEL